MDIMPKVQVVANKVYFQFTHSASSRLWHGRFGGDKVFVV